MSMRSLKALPVVAAGFLVGVLPALGSSTNVTDSGTSWVPAAVQIEVGDDVRWEWTGFHNVKFADGPRSGDPQGGGSFERTFTTTGTFNYMCEQHGSSMSGSVTVTQASTGTTGTTGTGTTGTETTGTETTGTGTTPTNTTPTNTTTAPGDSSGPVITGLKRRSSRTLLRVSFRSDEDGTLQATIRRRNPGAKAFRVVGRRTAAMSKGANTVTLQRAARGLRRGAYRVTLSFVDASGNESTTKTLNFKIA